jgi:hypothetical protein
MVSASFERPLNGGAETFQANFTMAYYFER